MFTHCDSGVAVNMVIFIIILFMTVVNGDIYYNIIYDSGEHHDIYGEHGQGSCHVWFQ